MLSNAVVIGGSGISPFLALATHIDRIRAATDWKTLTGVIA